MIKLEFEGTDGAGKTTGLKYFIEQAQKRGLSVVETREVGNPNVPICVKLREIVLSKDSGLSGEAMEFVFAAMRFENDKWLKSLPKPSHLTEREVVTDVWNHPLIAVILLGCLCGEWWLRRDRGLA